MNNRKLSRIFSFLLLTLALSSCGPKKSAPTTQAKVFLGALTGFSNPVMLYGGSIEANHTFAKKIMPTENDIVLDLKQGAWKFYALYWDGAQPFEGNLSCFATETVIEGENMDVNITLSQTGCNDPALFPASLSPQQSFIFNGCSTLSDVVDENSLCDLMSKGHGESYRVIFPQWSPSSIELVIDSATAAITSNCFNKGAISNIKMPIGSSQTFFQPLVVSYENSNCLGEFKETRALHTFSKAVNLETKEFNNGSNNFLFFIDRGPESLKVIHTAIGNSCDEKFDMKPIGTKTVFFGPDANYGSMPFVLDEVNEVVTELATGNESTYNIMKYGNQVLFNSDDGTNGNELWITDGTIPGTYMLKDIDTGATASTPSKFKLFNGFVYFVANTAGAGMELWKTDGTNAGTVMVYDLYAGANSGLGSVSEFVLYNNELYFAGDDGATGTELYKVDTSDTVSLVQDIYPGATGSQVSNLVNFNGKLFFVADDGVNGIELHSWDGSTLTMHTNFTNAYPFNGGFTTAAGKIIFSGDAGDGIYGSELYEHDGVSASATLLHDIFTGVDSSYPTFYKKLPNGGIILKANNGSNNQLYYLAPDLTLNQIYPGQEVSNLEDMITHDGKTYMILSFNSAESKLYKFDPLSNNLIERQGICPSGCTSWPAGKFGVSAKGKLYIKKVYYSSPDYFYNIFRMGPL
ncbi:hypothetical protein [Halobacteriovorax marinus]|uniref:hypothetical protein n=1 Tax=Halobacteriovorax marinus TaxID=97084 RepID=UPI003A8CE804